MLTVAYNADLANLGKCGLCRGTVFRQLWCMFSKPTDNICTQTRGRLCKPSEPHSEGEKFKNRGERTRMMRIYQKEIAKIKGL